MREYKRVRGFVVNKRSGHPSYAYWQKDNKVNSVGFTHNKYDIADKQKLKHNIDPKDTSDCYVKTKIEKQRYNDYRYNSNYAGYRIHKDDRQTIQNIVANDKSRNKKRRH